MNNPEDKRTFPWRLWLARLPLLVLAVVVIVLMADTERFLTGRTLASIVTLASVVGVLAVGQAFVLIGGGFDLSQGAIVGLTAAITAWLVRAGAGPVAAMLVALAAGAALGAINGAFVAGVGTNPFVTTLSTMLIYRGATFVVLRGRVIGGIAAFSALDQALPFDDAPVGMRALVFLGVAALAWLVLRQTVFGQHIYAVGANAEAARLAGVRTGRVRVAAFATAGLAAGVAAVMLLSWLRVAKPDTGAGYELSSIAACVVGGVSLQGGAGSVLGAVAGRLLLETLDTLLTMRTDFPDEYRTLVTGAVILIFAAADAAARRIQQR